MCILFVCFGVLEEWPLLIADNRDEDTPRETLPLHTWDDHPDVSILSPFLFLSLFVSCVVKGGSLEERGLTLGC